MDFVKAFILLGWNMFAWIINVPFETINSSIAWKSIGGAVPALAQLASSSYHAVVSSPSLPPPQDQKMHGSRSSSTLWERRNTTHINAWWGLDKDLVLHISLLLCSLLGFIILICYRQISNSSLHNFLLLIDFILIAFAVCQLMKFSVPSFGPYKLHLACTVLSLCTNHHLLLPVVFWDIS